MLGSSLPMRLHHRVPLTIIFSILRSLLLTVLLLFSLLLPGPASPFNPLSPLEKFDVFIVDQQSVCVPLLRFVSGSRVVFYCHFPDKLLSAGWTIGPDGESVRETGGVLRRLYRWPIDKLEEWTTGMRPYASQVGQDQRADRQDNQMSFLPTPNSQLQSTRMLSLPCGSERRKSSTPASMLTSTPRPRPERAKAKPTELST